MAICANSIRQSAQSIPAKLPIQSATRYLDQKMGGSSIVLAHLATLETTAKSTLMTVHQNLARMVSVTS